MTTICRRKIEGLPCNSCGKCERDIDLIGRPLLTGGARGEQKMFLNPEDYKTLQYREKLNAKNDITGQKKLF